MSHDVPESNLCPVLGCHKQRGHLGFHRHVRFPMGAHPMQGDITEWRDGLEIVDVHREIWRK